MTSKTKEELLKELTELEELESKVETKNIKEIVDKRGEELYREWKKENPMFFTDNGYEPCYQRFRLDALIEYLNNQVRQSILSTYGNRTK